MTDNESLNEVLVIAEAGVNHNGDLETAKKLVEVAARAGADYVKFQTFSAETLATADAPQAEYQRRSNPIGTANQLEMLRKLELSKEDHIELIKHCEKHGIRFLSTGFDVGSLDLLFSLGVRLFKIPSGELTNYPYLVHVASLKCPVILSTGMATIPEIRWALETLVSAGQSRQSISILHCTTSYPTPMAQANLLAIQTLRTEFDLQVGYSDHTLGLEASIAAVALGAKIIEKHFTLSRDQHGPDHAASLEPLELESLVRSIRETSASLGDGMKVPQDCELENIAVARKSIVASRDIQKGDMFTKENLTTKRPGNGISPMRWKEIIGTRARRAFRSDEMINLE
jgi:N,N'-diacetyllegionaminate synthase